LIEGMTREPHVSERTCIVTRQRGAPEAMIRFVCGPDGALAPDIKSRLPGRGVWVTARADLVEQAARKRLFARSLKTQVDAAPRLADDVDRLLEADCLQMLSLANKAGAVMAGFGKVADSLAQGSVGALIEASDGGEDGKRKLAQAARRAGSTAPVVGLFSSLQLDLALGRTNVIHAALAEGGPTTAFVARCRRLAAYRGVSVDGETATDDEIEAQPNGGAKKG
jgi:predicted RNA-binding protein YlxR (DUF448 family)